MASSRQRSASSSARQAQRRKNSHSYRSQPHYRYEHAAESRTTLLSSPQSSPVHSPAGRARRGTYRRDYVPAEDDWSDDDRRDGQRQPRCQARTPTRPPRHTPQSHTSVLARKDYGESPTRRIEKTRSRGRPPQYHARHTESKRHHAAAVYHYDHDHYPEKESFKGSWWKRHLRGGRSHPRRSRRRAYSILAGLVIVIVIAVAVGVTVSKKKSGSPVEDTKPADNNDTPSNSNLASIQRSSIPKQAQGTELDPFSWYDTAHFNVTYTEQTVGGLPVMGLNSSWDDTTRANDHVPSLDTPWSYDQMPIRGINVGGWFSLEPLITPSFFESYKSRDNIVDEWTLCERLGPARAKSTLEKHYATFITEADFAAMRSAGFDHVRIPFSYWAVVTYDDPYVARVSWRYLLRAIEWARKNGLRVNLDLHGAPGSQNGWNHSGHQGSIGWLNGTDGQLNAQRTIDIHNQLSEFFAQSRYKNIIAIYGLVNEPRMVALDVEAVLDWTTLAISTVRKNNITAIIAFGDGFLGLDNWQGRLQDQKDLFLDVHQYAIFNVDQIVLNHHDKTNFACGGWTAQTVRSENKQTGFGYTLCGEWSQADTDCATYLNNVGVGSRWQGTLNTVDTPGGALNGSVLEPTCPTANSPRCSCDEANADPSTYTPAYKRWLREFAEAQMTSFEKGRGWFYWTWKTERASQWSYEAGLAAGTLPAKTWDRSFDCAEIPDYAGMGLPEYY